jgi:D-serine deaminase-like pyridoxal phosphate-dependent protein
MTSAGPCCEEFRAMLDGLGLTTPCVVVDMEVLDANLAGMAEDVSQRGAKLRPHFKTHKSVEIARRQLALGANGLSCATVGEAEALADHGFGDIFIAYPLWADGVRGRRLRGLQDKTHLRVGVDSNESVQHLAAATRGGPPLEVVIEIDPGFHRSGVVPAEAARVAGAAEDCGLTVSGVFTYPGHAYDSPIAIEPAAEDEQRALIEASVALVSAGVETTVTSGGSTPTARLSAGRGVNEVRPGVYAFNDRQQVELRTCREEDVALVVLTTVVSTSVPGFFVVDAGSKALSSDRLPWMEGFGVVRGAPDLVVRALSEHHGVVKRSDDIARPRVGEIVAIVPNHVCNVVNLFDDFVVVGGDGVIERWSVLSRGRNS